MKKIAIVGFLNHRDQAPYDDPDWQVWTVNDGWKLVRRFDRLYELHGKSERNPSKAHEDWLQAATCPVYAMYPEPQWPTAVQFPYQAILGALPRRYITVSVSWLIAHAYLEGATDVGVYGIDLAMSFEFSIERPSVEYLLGYLEGKGVNIHLPTGCNLLHSPTLYGLDETAWERQRLLEQRRSILDRVILCCKYGMTEEAMALIGAAEQTEDMMLKATSPAEEPYAVCQYCQREQHEYCQASIKRACACGDCRKELHDSNKAVAFHGQYL